MRKKLLTTIFLSGFLFFCKGKDVSFSSCYTGYYFFIPVLENCINYVEKDEKGRFEANVKTIGFLKIFKDIKYSGVALSEKDISRKFSFYQKEKDFYIKYWYEFVDDKIFARKEISKNGRIIKRLSKIVKNHGRFLDPFTASVVMFKGLNKNARGYMKVFFNGKKYKIPYWVEKEERLFINGKKYTCYVVNLKPEIKGEGLIKTKGIWKVWVDKKSLIPVKVKAVFNSGIIYLKLKNQK